MDRRGLLFAIMLTPAFALGDEPEKEYTNDELKAALTRAVELLTQMDAKLDAQDAEIKKLHDRLSTDTGCT